MNQWDKIRAFLKRSPVIPFVISRRRSYPVVGIKWIKRF